MAPDLLQVRPREVASADEEDVEKTIAVVIEEADTATEGFENGGLARFFSIAGDERDTRISGHVLEIARPRRGRGRSHFSRSYRRSADAVTCCQEKPGQQQYQAKHD